MRYADSTAVALHCIVVCGWTRWHVGWPAAVVDECRMLCKQLASCRLACALGPLYVSNYRALQSFNVTQLVRH